MKDEVDVVEKEKNPLDIRHSRSNSTYRNGSRSVTIRKRLEVMSRQCEMMEKEKDGLQRALGDREEEISSLLSTKEHVQTSLNHVQGKYQELLSQLAHWRAVLESDDAVKQWAVERESIQREYDQMEQEYNLQCSELNAARERISLLLQQLDRCENIVSITQESSQKEKDVLKHKIAVQEGEIQRLLAKLDYVITTPPSSDGKGSAESAVVRCEKVWLMHC
jgi:chromosome segregation ATPase